ncbi:MAG: PLP-dependent aminotransferase family protein [Alphaproteobacteria bacterium]|nr:PLP-dependent aminotransferase family protein [Alphaproteobacteria bacterium]
MTLSAVDLLQERWAAGAAMRQAATLQRSLYDCLRKAVLDGGLPPSTRLPASRDLAQALNLSRNTVKAAFEQLVAEGYLRAATGSGTYVCDVLPEEVLWASSEKSAGRPEQDWPTPEIKLSKRGSQVLERTWTLGSQWAPFVSGVPDVEEFPQKKFDRLEALWRGRQRAQWLTYGGNEASRALRIAIADYLRQARSVRCEPDQIVITDGVHQAVELTTRLLADVGDSAWVEDPGYWGIRKLLAINGLRVIGRPVDAEGMTLPASKRHAVPKIILVTPSHQYPLGAVMSLRRRGELLDYAIRNKIWIVEDDYDSEFRFSGHPIPCLQGLVPNSPVIYIGTFSKTLYPGLRVAYMVLPRAACRAFSNAHSELHRMGRQATHATLAAFLAEGHFSAHIRKMRLIYAQRRHKLRQLILDEFGEHAMHPFDSNAGLHLVMRLPDGVDDVAIADHAKREGIVVQPLSRYHLQPKNASGLLLGFGAVHPDRMEAPFKTLAKVIRAAS